MNKFKKLTALERATSGIIPAAFALLTILLLSYSQPARAGWSVNVGASSGKGTITIKVSRDGVTNVVTTPFGQNPSAAINQQSNNLTFAYTGSLPAGASPSTYTQVRAVPFKTYIESSTATGDGNDGDETLQFVIPRSACASGAVTVEAISNSPTSITFQYKAKLSDEGSAALVRVIDAVTGQQRFVVLLTGPSDNTGNTCEGTFTVNGNPDQLNLVLDGSTSTLPFSVACPPDMVVPCGAPLPAAYFPPAVASGVTGPFTYTYNPLPSQLVPGITNTVTVTARDTNGCTTKCQFNVYVQAMSFDGFYAPLGTADVPGVNCSAPLRTFKLGNTVPVKFAMLCGGVPVTGGVPPTIRIQNCAGSAAPYVGAFTAFNNEWHFNIDSTVIGTGAKFAGNYTITATLPDGSQHSTVIQYKK